jgi:hypothetical protein
VEAPKRGRPKKIDLVSIDQALEIIARYRANYGRGPLSRKYLYNCISAKKLQNHGSRSLVLLDKSRVIDVFCNGVAA